MIGMDSNAYTFLVQANAGDFNPALCSDPAVAEEKVAMFRIFTYSQILYVLPTVKAEASVIRDLNKKELHKLFSAVLLDEIPGLDPVIVEARAQELLLLHKEEKDCRVVAEAESGGLKVLLTFDIPLLKNLMNHTRGVALRRPSEHWTAMHIPRGERRVWEPHQTHPLCNERWWKWEQ